MAEENQAAPQGENPSNSAPTESVANPTSAGAEAQLSREEVERLRLEAEALRKEKQQLEMERNLQRNRAEEEERKRLEEKENFAELYHREVEARQKREAEEAEKRAEQFRKEVIASYPDEATRRAAEALINKNPQNLVWTDGASEELAKLELTSQLDALRETITPAKPTQPTVEPLNPHPGSTDENRTPQFNDLDVKKMEDELDRQLKGAGF